MITALIPAHNEAANITATIDSLRRQTVPVDRILVACDNCADDTARLALDVGADVFTTVSNTARKAGALNQALRHVTTDLVLILDADTVLVPTWIECALGAMTPSIAAVGAVFTADTSRGWLRGCQAREWFRYSEQIGRTGKTFVLSGTASLIRASALRAVGGYDETSITEDFALTIALKGAGFNLASPLACVSVTETMPTVKALFNQRRRWSLGAIQTVVRAGLRPHTRLYWGQQFMLLVSCLAMAGAIALNLLAAVTGTLTATLVSWIVLGAFQIERTVSVWPMGPRHRLVAALVLPELVYAIILQVSHLSALGQAVRGSSGTWAHL